MDRLQSLPPGTASNAAPRTESPPSISPPNLFGSLPSELNLLSPLKTLSHHKHPSLPEATTITIAPAVGAQVAHVRWILQGTPILRSVSVIAPTRLKRKLVISDPPNEFGNESVRLFVREMKVLQIW
ncbi:hypothetical protein Acr_19g0000020 [Actinidia rufa]|uniref:Uncharacterized protein n=1 Tax=Actinidia rufa TaxID=165716 RepID=A0A7J0G8C8_9ERIC|nr:hypothetical protein Acr_19g0000020 [Actinidia rufa]